MRIVLDTNVLLSALVFPGSKPDEILACIRARLHASTEHGCRVADEKRTLPFPACG
jgi:hypothetical protein